MYDNLCQYHRQTYQRQTYQKYSSEPYNKLKQTKLIKDENKIKTKIKL